MRVVAEMESVERRDETNARFGKIGFVAMICGIAILAPGAASAAGPEYSPLPMPRTGSDTRAEAAISQSAEVCEGSVVGCWLGLNEQAPARRNFGRDGSEVDGGGNDPGGGSSQ